MASTINDLRKWVKMMSGEASIMKMDQSSHDEYDEVVDDIWNDENDPEHACVGSCRMELPHAGAGFSPRYLSEIVSH